MHFHETWCLKKYNLHRSIPKVFFLNLTAEKGRVVFAIKVKYFKKAKVYIISSTKFSVFLTWVLMLFPRRRSLRRGSWQLWTLGSRVRIPLVIWMCVRGFLCFDVLSRWRICDGPIPRQAILPNVRRGAKSWQTKIIQKERPRLKLNYSACVVVVVVAAVAFLYIGRAGVGN